MQCIHVSSQTNRYCGNCGCKLFLSQEEIDIRDKMFPLYLEQMKLENNEQNVVARGVFDKVIERSIRKLEEDENRGFDMNFKRSIEKYIQIMEQFGIPEKGAMQALRHLEVSGEIKIIKEDGKEKYFVLAEKGKKL